MDRDGGPDEMVFPAFKKQAEGARPAG